MIDRGLTSIEVKFLLAQGFSKIDWDGPMPTGGQTERVWSLEYEDADNQAQGAPLSVLVGSHGEHRQILVWGGWYVHPDGSHDSDQHAYVWCSCDEPRVYPVMEADPDPLPMCRHMLEYGSQTYSEDWFDMDPEPLEEVIPLVIVLLMSGS